MVAQHCLKADFYIFKNILFHSIAAICKLCASSQALVLHCLKHGAVNRDPEKLQDPRTTRDH